MTEKPTVEEAGTILQEVVDRTFLDQCEHDALTVFLRAHAALLSKVAQYRAALENIESTLDDEIKARWSSSSISEERAARNSRVYHLLALPRNMARAALSGDPT